MQDVFIHFDRLRETREWAALAVLISVDGGSTKRLGARMWVATDGERFGSLTVGGCVEGRTAEEAVEVLVDGRPRRIRVDLGYDSPDFGMSCAGSVDVFIERVNLRDSHIGVIPALDAVRSLLDARRRAVWMTKIGPHPEHFVLTADDEGPVIVMPPAESVPLMRGEQGVDGGLPPVVLSAARSLMAAESGRSILLALDADEAPVLLQAFAPSPVLVIVGTGPTAEPLVRIAKLLGFRVVLVEARRDRVKRELFPDADEVLCGIPSAICGRLALDEDSFVAVIAHDYKHEVPVLREVLQRGVRYVGFVAGRRRGQAVLDFLASSGVDPDLLRRVRVPIGLDVGAESPAEIALSIAAEMLAVRSGRTGGPLRSGSDTVAEAGDGFVEESVLAKILPS